jgi:dihydroorotase (multifunctional complex type)
MKVIARTGLRVGFHAENNQINNHRTRLLKAAGRTDPKAYAEARPNEAEADAVAKVVQFARMTGAKVHIFHMSTKEGVDLVAAAKAAGVDISAETAPHYLLTDVDLMDQVGSMLKVNPPVRTRDNGDRLWQGLVNGIVEAIATDHAPHTLAEKINDNIWEVECGFCGVETSAPLMLTAVNEGRLTLNQYVKVASEGPARIFNMYPQKGSLQPGTDADLTIVDMEEEGIIKAERLHSKSKVTPFEGFKIKGQPVCTIVRGQFIVKDGELVGRPGTGDVVKPVR